MNYAVSLLFMIVSCNPSVTKVNTCRLGDVVKFQFKERNLFYNGRCQDVGKVVDFVSVSGNTSYLIELDCVDDRYHTAWIDASDIVSVVKLADSIKSN